MGSKLTNSDVGWEGGVTFTLGSGRMVSYDFTWSPYARVNAGKVVAAGRRAMRADKIRGRSNVREVDVYLRRIR